MSERETYTTLVFSTGHITKNDSILLSALGSKSDTGVESTQYGWRIWTPNEEDALKARETEFDGIGLSDQLLKLIREAHVCGCRWIEFDRDGEIYDDLEKYEW